MFCLYYVVLCGLCVLCYVTVCYVMLGIVDSKNEFVEMGEETEQTPIALGVKVEVASQGQLANGPIKNTSVGFCMCNVTANLILTLA